jgi:hypothetical protein
MSKIATLNQKTRCTHRTADGRRCQMPFAPNHTALCTHDALQNLQLLDMKAVAEEIVGPLGDFRSAYAINRSLGKLFSIAAENRIPPRNAAILAYIGQLLLQTLNPLRQEAIEMGMAGRTHAIFNDAMNHLGDESPNAPPPAHFSTAARPNSLLQERVEESLAILKNAGVSLSPDIIRKLRSGVEDEDEVEGNEEEEDADEQLRAEDPHQQTSERSEI